jgi:hypothetical protein
MTCEDRVNISASFTMKQKCCRRKHLYHNLRYFSGHSPGVTEECHTNFVTIGCIPAQTGIGHIVNTNERCYYFSYLDQYTWSSEVDITLQYKWN